MEDILLGQVVLAQIVDVGIVLVSVVAKIPEHLVAGHVHARVLAIVIVVSDVHVIVVGNLISISHVFESPCPNYLSIE